MLKSQYVDREEKSYDLKKGEKVISMTTRQGQWRDFKFQLYDVTRPLASVHKICEAGHSVTFNPSWDSRGSCIQDWQSGEKIWLAEKDGVFVLGTKVVPTEYQSKPSFTRQGRR